MLLGTCRNSKLKKSSESQGSSDQQAQELRLVLQEWLATLTQRHYGKSTSGSDAAYLASLLDYIPLQLLGPAEIDPLQQLHPLEQPGVPDTLQPDWQEQILARLRNGAKGEEGGYADVPPHPVYMQFSRGAQRLVALLGPVVTGGNAAADTVACDDNKGFQPSGPGIQAVWQDWEQGMLQALLLRWRTARYNSSPAMSDTTAHAAESEDDAAAAKGEATWEPAQIPSVLDLLLSRLREATASQMQAYRKARVAAATEKLVAAAAGVLYTHQHDASAASAALQQLYLSLGPQQVQDVQKRPEGSSKGPLAVLLGQQVCLQRSDVPNILEVCISRKAAGTPTTDSPTSEADGQQTTPYMTLLAAYTLLLQAARQASPADGSAGLPSVDQQSSTTPADTPAATDTAAPGLMVAAAQSSKPSITSDMLRALVLGDWCTQGPQALKRASLVLQLCQELGSEGVEVLEAIMSLERCVRTSRPNRNGHSSKLPYPGPAGYSIEYAAMRKAALQKQLREASDVRKLRKERKLEYYMESMRKFRDVVAMAETAAAGDEQKLTRVRAVVAGFKDANQVNKLVVSLQSVLGKTVV